MFTVVVADRRQGKTTHTIKWWLQDPLHRAIICSDHRRADRIVKTIHSVMTSEEFRDSSGIQLDLKRWNFDARTDFLARRRSWWKNILTLHTVDHLRGLDIREVIVDDFDDILAQMFGPIKVIAFTSSIPWSIQDGIQARDDSGYWPDAGDGKSSS